MNNKNLDVYCEAFDNGDKKAAHESVQGEFRTYRFHLSGCIWLLNRWIQYDVVDKECEDLPVALMQCINDCKKYKGSAEYKKAVADSERKEEYVNLHGSLNDHHNLLI